MTDELPAEAIRAVAERLYATYEAEFVADHLSWKYFIDEAADLIRAARPHIERQVRAKVADEIAGRFLDPDPTDAYDDAILDVLRYVRGGA